MTLSLKSTVLAIMLAQLSDQSLAQSPEDATRLLNLAEASYTANLEGFEYGRFEFVVDYAVPTNLSKARDPINHEPGIGKGFYAFDRHNHHYKIDYSDQDISRHNTVSHNDRKVIRRMDRFLVDFVSSGSKTMNVEFTFDPDQGRIYRRIVYGSGMERELESLVLFPLSLGNVISNMEDLREDLKMTYQRNDVKIERVESVHEGHLVLIKIKLRMPLGLRTYFIDPARGGVPVRIEGEVNSPSGNFSRTTWYDDIRDYPGKGWLPHQWTLVSSRGTVRRVKLTKVDVDRRPTSADFTIDTKEPVKVIVKSRGMALPERKRWSFDLVDDSLHLLPQDRLSHEAIAPPVLPGPRPKSWLSKPARNVFAIFVSFVIFSLICSWMSSKPGSPHRRGFSLIEVLVVIFVIGILIAIILPAVQSSRAAARRTQCVNNMKQMSLALSSYEIRHRTYPCTTYVSETDRKLRIFLYSVHAHLLRDVERANVYDSINFSLYPTFNYGLNANYSAMTTEIETFLCPSDQSQAPIGYGRSNLRFNCGPAPFADPDSTYFDSGPFTVFNEITSTMVTDGLSTTSGISERVQGSWDYGSFSKFSDYRHKSQELYNTGLFEVDRVLEFCRMLPGNTKFETRSGESWSISGLHSTNYNHVMTPNSSQSDCSYMGPSADSLNARTMVRGPISARSYHAGGVNVGFLDGHVRFVRTDIELAVWRALSTRNQGEAISADSY